MTETSTPEDWPVHCPFTAKGTCIAPPNEDGSPACPTPRERICVNGLDDE